MRAAGAFLLLLACAAPEAPAPPPPQPHANLQPIEQPHRAPAVPPRDWSVNMLVSGGVGGGMRAVTVRPDDPRLRCSPQIRTALTKAVAEAHPDSWKDVYAPAKPSGMTDQFHYSLNLKTEKTTHQAEWSSEGDGLLPPDLRALADAVIEAESELGKRCP